MTSESNEFSAHGPVHAQIAPTPRISLQASAKRTHLRR